MPRVFLGLGSNIEPEANLAIGVRELQRIFGAVVLSPVYRAPAIGFDSADFLNAVVAVETELAPEAILDIIEVIHEIAGRERSKDNSCIARTLDIDLLLYGDLVSPERPLRVPRGDVLDYAFVLRPLADLAPEGRHPQTGKTFTDHWREFDAAEQPLTLTKLSLDGAGE